MPVVACLLPLLAYFLLPVARGLFVTVACLLLVACLFHIDRQQAAGSRQQAAGSRQQAATKSKTKQPNTNAIQPTNEEAHERTHCCVGVHWYYYDWLVGSFVRSFVRE